MKLKSAYLLFILFLPSAIAAQSKTNSLSVNVEVPPNFSLDNITELETEHIIYNSLRLTVTSSKNNVLIYAAIPSGITGQGGYLPVNTVQLHLNHTTCPASYQQNVVTSDITMNNSASLLFKQKRKNKLTAHWYYDLKIPPIGYSYGPGRYNYTFQFTMTTQ